MGIEYIHSIAEYKHGVKLTDVSRVTVCVDNTARKEGVGMLTEHLPVQWVMTCTGTRPFGATNASK